MSFSFHWQQNCKYHISEESSDSNEQGTLPPKKRHTLSFRHPLDCSYAEIIFITRLGHSVTFLKWRRHFICLCCHAGGKLNVALQGKKLVSIVPKPDSDDATSPNMFKSLAGGLKSDKKCRKVMLLWWWWRWWW